VVLPPNSNGRCERRAVRFGFQQFFNITRITKQSELCAAGSLALGAVVSVFESALRSELQQVARLFLQAATSVQGQRNNDLTLLRLSVNPPQEIHHVPGHHKNTRTKVYEKRRTEALASHWTFLGLVKACKLAVSRYFHWTTLDSRQPLVRFKLTDAPFKPFRVCFQGE
jgi:hypothetical protein